MWQENDKDGIIRLVELRNITDIPISEPFAGMAELADAKDLKSFSSQIEYRFDPGCRHSISDSSVL